VLEALEADGPVLAHERMDGTDPTRAAPSTGIPWTVPLHLTRTLWQPISREQMPSPINSDGPVVVHHDNVAAGRARRDGGVSLPSGCLRQPTVTTASAESELSLRRLWLFLM
jgi:hypothetical protein